LQATTAEIATLPRFVEPLLTFPPVDAVLPEEGPSGVASWLESALPAAPRGPDAEIADEFGLTGVADPALWARDPTHIGHGTQVVTADDKILGHAERLTLDPATQRLTHLVIKHGLLVWKRIIFLRPPTQD
jgi:hypothetical protein